MHFGRAIDNDLERAVDQGKRKKPLSEHEKIRKRNEVFARWFNEKPEMKFRDPNKG